MPKKLVRGLKVGNRITPVLYEDVDPKLYGEYYLYGKHISISKDLLTQEDNEGLAYSIVHEALHAIWDQYNMPKRPTEESAVTTFSVALIDIFKENKGLLTYLNDLLTQESA